MALCDGHRATGRVPVPRYGPRGRARERGGQAAASLVRAPPGLGPRDATPASPSASVAGARARVSTRAWPRQVPRMTGHPATPRRHAPGTGARELFTGFFLYQSGSPVTGRTGRQPA
jgi:hypothetical protein